MKIVKLKIENYVIVAVLAALLSVYLVPPVPRASAGLIFKLPSNLGLSTNLVGHWTMDGPDVFEGGTKIQDKSGHNNTGTTAGNPTLGIGRIGQAMKFDGNGDYIDMGTPGVELDSTNFTVSAWVNIQGTPANEHTIFSQSTGGSFSLEFFVEADNSTFNFGQNTVASVASNTGVSPGTWTHLAVTFTDSTDLVAFYKNGASAGTASLSIINTTEYPWKIGVQTTGPNYANALIDDFRVYSRILSASEIKRLYNVGGTLKIGKTDTTSLTNGLVGHWTMDSEDISWTDGTIQDRSSIGNKGAFNGAMGTTSAPVIGRIGQALNFDGTDDFINAANESNFDFQYNNSFSSCAWVFPNDVATPHILVSKMNGGGSNDGWEMNLYDPTNAGADALNVYLINVFSSTHVQVHTPDASIVAGKWNHVCFTYNGNTFASGIIVYVNGVSQTKTIIQDTLGENSILNDKPVVIGARDGVGAPVRGKMDDVRIYNRVLTSSEIKRLYNMGGTLKIGQTDTTSLTSGLVGHWTMDGTDISWTDGNIRDRSGNGNKGAFNGAMGTTSAPVIGRIGQALKFDGNNDYLNMGSPSALTDNYAFTYCAWINPANVTGVDQKIYSKSGNSAPFGRHMTSLNNGALGIYSDYDDTDSFAGSPSGLIKINTWQHGCGSIDSSHVARLYYNGTEISSYDSRSTGAGSPLADSSKNAIIGHRSTLDENYFNGAIDEVRVYNRALTADEIKRLYNMGR